MVLPFDYSGGAQPPGIYLGRYLLCNQRLVGIRLSTYAPESAPAYPNKGLLKWGQGIVEKISTPQSYLNFYSQQGMQAYPTSIRVGDIILRLNNASIGFVFTSEAGDSQDYLKNRLLELVDLHCEVISVVEDVPRQSLPSSAKQLELGTKTENIIKNFRNSQRVVLLYGGVRMAFEGEVYFCNPYLVDPESRPKTIAPNLFAPSQTLNALCYLPTFRKREGAVAQAPRFTEITVNTEIPRVPVGKPGSFIITPDTKLMAIEMKSL